MRINFYDTRLSEDDRTMLVKEKGVNYETGKMGNPWDIVTLMRKLLNMEQLTEEHCYMIAMNSSGRVLGIFFILKGTVNMCPVSPRELYVRALLLGAVQIIICHNHPSGSAQPSKIDMDLTKKIREAGELLDVRLTDHIIIGQASYFSFGEAKML